MKRTLIFTTVLTLLVSALAEAKIGKREAMYVGGTANITQETVGTCSASDQKVFTFDYVGGKLSIPYERINELEYGQKAGRRLGLAIAVSPAALLSKKRKHFLTISYVNEQDKQQALVFELGKDTVRSIVASLQARTGRKIEFQDEEARRSFGN
jgi:hypothetical protein